MPMPSLSDRIGALPSKTFLDNLNGLLVDEKLQLEIGITGDILLRMAGTTGYLYLETLAQQVVDLIEESGGMARESFELRYYFPELERLAGGRVVDKITGYAKALEAQAAMRNSVTYYFFTAKKLNIIALMERAKPCLENVFTIGPYSEAVNEENPRKESVGQ